MDDNYIAQQLTKFNVSDAAIELLNKRFKELNIVSIEDANGYKAVRAARLEIKGYRVDVEKRRKELNEGALHYQRSINAEAKRITCLLSPLEDDLEAKEKAHEAEKERVKKELEEIEAKKLVDRVSAIQTIGFMFDGIVYKSKHSDVSFVTAHLKSMTDEIFAQSVEMLGRSYLAFTQAELIEQERHKEIKAKEEAERKAESERLEKQRKEQAEIARLQSEKERALIEEAERLNAEKQRLKESEERKISNDFSTLEEEKTDYTGGKGVPASYIEDYPKLDFPSLLSFENEFDEVEFSPPQQKQAKKIPEFTQEQKDFICHQIGEWYFNWKEKLIDYEQKTHKLGYAKELLKTMICGE